MAEAANPSRRAASVPMGSSMRARPTTIGRKIMAERTFSNILTPFLVEGLREQQAHQAQPDDHVNCIDPNITNLQHLEGLPGLTVQPGNQLDGTIGYAGLEKAADSSADSLVRSYQNDIVQLIDTEGVIGKTGKAGEYRFLGPLPNFL